MQTAENFTSTTYLTQVLLFLLHSNFAPLGSLPPPLSLFLSFLLVRGIETPLPTRGGLEQEEGEEEEPRQSLMCRKLLSGLKELQSEACMLLRLHPGEVHLTLLSIGQLLALCPRGPELRAVTREGSQFTPSWASCDLPETQHPLPSLARLSVTRPQTYATA